MDRERLKEIHQTDLTESKVNEDFVDWLKNKGPTWLLFILVGICIYLGAIRLRQGKAENRSEAWQALHSTELPGSLEEVAQEYADVDQLSNLAYLKAADRLLAAVQDGKKLGADVTTPDAANPTADLLTQEERDQYLTRADGLYRTVAEAVADNADLTLIEVNALGGRAAVAESRGDGETARTYYVQAADRAEGTYPGLATLLRNRSETTAVYSETITFLSQRELDGFQGPRVSPEPADIDEALREFLLPEEAGEFPRPEDEEAAETAG